VIGNGRGETPNAHQGTSPYPEHLAAAGRGATVAAVSYDEFLSEVARQAGIERDEAERTSIEVLQELCDRLTGDEAHDLLAQLPARLKTRVVVSPSAQPITADEFVERVADQLELSPGEARERIRAVFATIRRAVSLGEFDDVLAQLDPEYADLLA
jgi:uncharacterized protein (DUF2267 family)